jgi:mannose-6-phosphate isomerase-like protein (cupin superfamily)
MHAVVQKTEFTVGNTKIKTVMQDGFSKRGSERSVEMHQHPNFEIHYIEEGRFSLDYDDKSVTLFKDTLVIIPPNVTTDLRERGKISSALVFSSSF